MVTFISDHCLQAGVQMSLARTTMSKSGVTKKPIDTAGAFSSSIFFWVSIGMLMGLVNQRPALGPQLG